MTNWGSIILNAYKKSQPILLNGTTKIAGNSKFSLQNPYILEVLPDELLKSVSIFEGKKLVRVCEALDNPNIINRYVKFCNKFNKGFSENELINLYKKAFPNIKIPTDANLDAMIHLASLNSKIGNQFDAHGLAKANIPEQLKQLNELLTKGIDKTRPFHTAPLTGQQGVGAGLGCAGSAYTDGSFIIVSGKGKTLIDDGIENVIVNDVYYSIINELKSKFPHINFVKANESVDYFSNLVK
ncbi:MAG: hypothetical protein MJ230_04825 [bacterium]|nr:hypothetical protein [bacterium]